MKQNHERLLQVLQLSQTPCSSRQLAELLHVSSRTIKNYIQEINEVSQDLIRSSKQGYFLDAQYQSKQSKLTIPQSYQERSSYIIKEFFIKQKQEIDIYELCDALYLSYSSIKSLLQRMNKEFEADHIMFRCKNDRIFIQGKERDQRKFLTKLIYKEASDHFIDITLLSEMFPNIDVSYINEMLHTCFKQENCYINDFGYINLTLHITVMINSMLSKQERTQLNDSCEFSRDEAIIQTVLHALQTHFSLVFSPMEKEELSSMIHMNIHMCQINSEEEIRNEVGEEIFQLTQDLIHAWNSHYHLHVQEKTLLLPLSLHLKNLMKRIHLRTFLHNPLLETIQASCPLLFDCALFAADFLYERLAVKLTRDEIAYIAMHVGADIERQDENIHKLKCILLCPDYQGMRSQMFNHLLIHFDSQIQMIQTVSFLDEITEPEYDVLFTTVPVESCSHTIVKLPPFPSQVQDHEIFHILESVFEKRKLAILHQEFDRFFSESLCYVVQEESLDKHELLSILFHQLYEQGHVHQQFYMDVCKRDEAASTAFGKIAIPHSMKMDAIHTKIALAICKDGISWDACHVHIVLLIAINEKDSYLFKQLYEALIVFFSQEQMIQLACNAKNFQEFKDILFRFTK